MGESSEFQTMFRQQRPGGKRRISMLRLVSYRSDRTASTWQAGATSNNALIDLSGYTSATSHSVAVESYRSVRAFLSASPNEQEQVLAWAARQLDEGDQLLSLDQVELGPPVPDPEKIVCLGLNYPEHAAEAELDIPPVPTFFAKFRNSLVGPTSPVILPPGDHFIDYEGELAVVIGKRCKHVSEQEALAYVAGYTVCNDVSARMLQMQTSQWTAGKAIDTFLPMGPAIVLAADIPYPQTLTLTTRVNGEVVQLESTSQMIFSVAKTLAFLSSFMTLEPGDLIATGTPSGIGARRQPPLFLQPGDIVEVEIERIGMIRNQMVAEEFTETR
jgi:2-keto-4-pentenoate hydratase/2-oxohepta-3-ene-1,7-dioic acid hydratase in catechol pathway